MTVEIILLWLLLGISILLFITEWLRADLVAVLVLIVLGVSGLVSPMEALQGFSNPAVVTVVALLIMAEGLTRTGVVRSIANTLKSLGGNSNVQLISLSTAISGLLSGFINIVAAVTVLIPAILRMSTLANIPASRLLMPMAFAGLAGANLTIIGASHNLVVNEILIARADRGFSFFELFPLGLALVMLVIVYSLVFSRFLLPDNGNRKHINAMEQTRQLTQTYSLQDYLWEVWIENGCSAIGKSLSELKPGSEHGLSVISLVREHEDGPIITGDVVLEEGDVLLLGGEESRVRQLCEEHDHLIFKGQPSDTEDFSSSSAELVEVIVPQRSSAIGKSLREMAIRKHTGLTAVALWRNNKAIISKVRDTPLLQGDGILFFGARSRIRNYDPDDRFIWSNAPRPEEAPQELRHLAIPSALILGLVILVAAFDWISIPIAALSGAALMILIGSVTVNRAYESISWQTVVLIACMIPLGNALADSGAARLLSDGLISLIGESNQIAALLCIATISLILTQPMHNAVVAVIMTPVALDMARIMNASPHAFAAAVIAGASAAFLLPAGHPAGLLVQQPGNYKPMEYFRFGAGLSVLYVIVIVLLIPQIWND